MKKVLAIAVLLLIVAAGAAMASATNWLIYLNADSMDGTDFGVASQVGVKPLGSDLVDTYDGSPIDFGTSSNTTKWAVDALAGDAYPKNFMSTAAYTTYPASQKVWSFRVGGLTGSTGAIRFQFKTSTSTATAAPAADANMKYLVKLVHARGMVIPKPAWAGGGTWAEGGLLTLTVPTTTSSWFGEIDLPLLKLSNNGNPQMLTEGYDLQFIQGAVPEPGSLLVLGTGLVGLVGFVSRRRRV